MEIVQRQMKDMAANPRYLYWEGLHLANLYGGFDALRSSLICGLTEALFLNRTFVMPSHVAIRGCTNKAQAGFAHLSMNCATVSIHDVFDVQVASIQQRVILSDTAEWAAAYKTLDPVRVEPTRNRTFAKSAHLAIQAGNVRALNRVPSERGSRGLGFLALCQGGPQARAVPAASVRGRGPKLNLSPQLLTLVQSVRKALGYYDSIRIDFAENFQGFAAGSRGTREALIRELRPRMEARRNLFIEVRSPDRMAGTDLGRILKFGDNVKLLKDFVILMPSLTNNSLVQEVAQRLVFEGGFEQLVLEVGKSFVRVASSNKVEAQPAHMNVFQPTDREPGKPYCHVNPIAFSQNELEKNGYSTLFREGLSFRPRECPPGNAEGRRGSAKSFLREIGAYVLTLPGQERWRRVAAAAATHGINVTAWYGVGGYRGDKKQPPADQNGIVVLPGHKGYKLKSGEVGYLLTMRNLFLHAQKRGVRALLVFDDDALLHQDFGSKLERILEKSRRCSDFLREGGRGGILKLGASEWRPDTWKWVEDEIQHRVYDENEALCYNANLRSYGSFAVLYSEQTYQYIIDWANRQLDGGEFPFDHVFKHITLNGTIVRVAYPNLVIMDVAHVSSVDPKRKSQQDLEIRRRRHNWDVALYPLTHTLLQRQAN